jgi:hypothetical protein
MAFIPFSFRSIANTAERGGIIEGDNHSIANTAERGVRSINSNLSTN